MIRWLANGVNVSSELKFRLFRLQGCKSFAMDVSTSLGVSKSFFLSGDTSAIEMNR